MKSFLKVFRLVIAFIFVWPIFPMAFIGLIFYYLFYILHLKKVAIAVSRAIYYFVCWWMLTFLGGSIHVVA